MKFTLIQPVKIRYGAGCFADVGDESAGLGRRALVACGRTAMRRAGVLSRLQDLLIRAGVESVLFDRVENDPSRETVAAGAELARRESCDQVIAIGGGSSLDAGKAIAVMARQDGDIAEYHEQRRQFEHPSFPLIAIPTTAGSGAEVTNNAVITDAAAGIKSSLRGPGLGATVALVDPELTLTLSPEATAHSGMDALTQAMECYISSAAHSVSDALALQAIQLIAPNLEKACRDGANLAHREPVMLGALLAGMAFANAGLGVVHGLAHPLGARLRLPHGFVCAVLLPYALEFNRPARPEKYGEMARVLRLESDAELISRVRALNRSLGVPENLRARGFDESLFPRVLAECRGNSMSRNPRPVADEDVIAILRRLL